MSKILLQKLIDFPNCNSKLGRWVQAEHDLAVFPVAASHASLEEKIEDIGLLHALNQSSGAISLHIPWDIPKMHRNIKALAAQYDLKFDAVNSNTFQDQPDQEFSYKFGSLQHVDANVRKQAIEHNIEVIKYGLKRLAQSH